MKAIRGLWLVLLLALPTLAQTVDDRTAETVFRDYNAYSQKQDWSGMASLLHPDSLAQYRTMLTKLVDRIPEMSREIFKLKSKTEFGALTDAQIFERLFSHLYATSPEMEAAMKNMKVTVVGSVEETPDLRHVIYRANFQLGATAFSDVEVYTVKRFQSTWRVLMSETQIRAMTAGLEASPTTTPVKKAPPAKPPPAKPRKRT